MSLIPVLRRQRKKDGWPVAHWPVNLVITLSPRFRDRPGLEGKKNGKRKYEEQQNR